MNGELGNDLLIRNDETFMNIALIEAEEGYQKGEVPGRCSHR